jgi:hypothetical protein
LHTLAACLNAGELGSIELGIARKYPRVPRITLYPVRVDGGDPLRGSGKPEMPRRRMHSEIWSS